MRLVMDEPRFLLTDVLYKYKEHRAEGERLVRQGNANISFKKGGLRLHEDGKYALIEIDVDFDTSSFYLNASGFVGFPINEPLPDENDLIKKAGLLLDEETDSLRIVSEKLIDHLLSITVTRPSVS